jgi:two-component system chemotaxis response regulator CheB
VVGVVLSGALDDGTSGLWSIKRLGGITVVQQPNDARFESMPLSAIKEVEVDQQLPAAEIGPLLVRLAETATSEGVVENRLRERINIEIKIAAESNALDEGVMNIGDLTPFTCPECHGVLVKLKEDNMTRYRCHTGHAYSDSALIQDVMEHTGELMSQAMRSLEEAVMLLQHMAQHMENAGSTDRARDILERAHELQSRSKVFHREVLAHESLSGEKMVAEADARGGKSR